MSCRSSCAEDCRHAIATNHQRNQPDRQNRHQQKKDGRHIKSMQNGGVGRREAKGTGKAGSGYANQPKEEQESA